MIWSILKMHNHQYEQFDAESLDFIKLAFTNQRFRNLIGRDNVKEFHIKWTAHIVDLKENDDTGINKNIREEGDPYKVGDRKQDMKSEEVNERVKLLKVQDPIMNPKKTRFIVRFQILSMIEQALFELLSRINCWNI